MRKILVLCETNASRSQMAAAYLRVFTDLDTEVYSAGLAPKSVHPLAFEVMLDDNIDIAFTQSKPISDYAGQHFDYLITVYDEAESRHPRSITANHYLSCKISDPEITHYANEEEKLAAFLNTREAIKREMLRFIGRHDELKFVTARSAE